MTVRACSACMVHARQKRNMQECKAASTLWLQPCMRITCLIDLNSGSMHARVGCRLGSYYELGCRCENYVHWPMDDACMLPHELPRARCEAGRATGDREVDREAEPCIMALSERKQEV